MNKQSLFQQAHAEARKIAAAVGDYMVAFKLALKQAWASLQQPLEQRLAKIGKLWERGEMKRLYFNGLEQFIGLEFSTYKTGNIKSARLNGESISNTQARGIVSQLSYGKVYFDLADKKFYGRDIDRDLLTTIVDGIKAAA